MNLNDDSSQNFHLEKYFKFNNIDTYIEVFTQNTTPENFGNNIEVFNRQINKLEELFKFYTKKIQEISVPKPYFKSDVSIYISNKVLFCSYYLFGKEVKLFRFQEYLYSKTISIIAAIISQMKKDKEESKITFCQIDELEMFLNDKIESNNYILSSQEKIKRLTSYIHPIKQIEYSPEIPAVQLKAALEETNKSMNSLCGYSPYGSFDDFLYYFIFLSNPEKIKQSKFNFLDETEKNFEFDPTNSDEKQSNDNSIDYLIDELVKISLSNLRKTNFISFHSENQKISFKIIEESIFSLLEIQKPGEQIILKTSLIRIIFDRLYQNSDFMNLLESKLDEESSALFARKCEIILAKTPKEMQISTFFLPDDIRNQPFKTIIENDASFLKEAVENMSFLEFFTNPVDILAHIFFVLKNCESFLLSHRKKTSSDDNSTDEENTFCFDDLFPFFCAVLSFCHPSNCMGIKHFLEIIKGFILNSQLNYANSIFLSAVSYITQIL